MGREGYVERKNAVDSRTKKEISGLSKKIRIAGKPGLLYNKIRQISAHRRKE